MALRKPIRQPEGVDANYWRIVVISADRLRGELTLRLAGYINEQARRDYPARGIMEKRDVTITGDHYRTVRNALDQRQTHAMGILYQAVKDYRDPRGERPWGDAEDIFDEHAVT